MQNDAGTAGSLGPQMVGEKIIVNERTLSVMKLLGEGAFSFVYLVRDENERSSSPPPPPDLNSNKNNFNNNSHCQVLKITSIHSREHKEIAEKEANLLQKLNHPSIVQMFNFSYRMSPPSNNLYTAGGLLGVVMNPDKNASRTQQQQQQHLILMEYCEQGHALDVMRHMEKQGERFSLTSLILAFGQICNAVSYLHAQKPPIVHRDLKPNNFLVHQNGSYKLCDFGSAIFGTVKLKSQLDRANAEEVIQKTTTQMFRAPEMVDLYMSDKLTESTDVWALGCCLYSMAFFQNCFEEGSNLAILSNNYKIPEGNGNGNDNHNHNPYGDELADLIDRMLTLDYKERADMTEVIMCLSALYAGKRMPSRKKSKKNNKHSKLKSDKARIGTYRTNGQGIHHPVGASSDKPIEVRVFLFYFILLYFIVLYCIVRCKFY